VSLSLRESQQSRSNANNDMLTAHFAGRRDRHPYRRTPQLRVALRPEGSPHRRLFFKGKFACQSAGEVRRAEQFREFQRRGIAEPEEAEGMSFVRKCEYA
jgi:hypothetical protein